MPPQLGRPWLGTSAAYILGSLLLCSVGSSSRVWGAMPSQLCCCYTWGIAPRAPLSGPRFTGHICGLLQPGPGLWRGAAALDPVLVPGDRGLQVQTHILLSWDVAGLRRRGDAAGSPAGTRGNVGAAGELGVSWGQRGFVGVQQEFGVLPLAVPPGKALEPTAPVDACPP